MTARPDITKPENMLAIQGDLVIVYRHGERDPAYVMTLVRVMGVGTQEMRLKNKQSKDHKPDWAFTQKFYDCLKPAGANEYGAKWTVTVKDKA